jgi:hypothetical protein
VKSTLDDARYVGVDGGCGSFEGEGGDCSGGVATDAGQCHEDRGVLWHDPVMLVNDLPRDAVQIGGTAVVPKTLPSLSHPPRACSGQGFDGWVAFEKAGIVLLHSCNLCLL